MNRRKFIKSVFTLLVLPFTPILKYVNSHITEYHTSLEIPNENRREKILTLYPSKESPLSKILNDPEFTWWRKDL